MTQINHGLSIREVFEPSEGKDVGDSEIQGEHPVHGSSTGTNTKIHTGKNAWCCYAHNSGGGVLEAIAVKEGIIQCAEAGEGCLSGKTGYEVMKVANKKYGADIDLGDSKDEDEIEMHQKVKDVISTTAQLAQGQLTQEDRERIKDERNLTDNDLDKYGIGKFTPQIDKTLRKRYNDDVLVESGLYWENDDDDKIGPMFTEYLPEKGDEVGRVIIPYKVYGQVKYFIGRRTPEMWEYWEEQSKKQENLHDIARIHHYSDAETDSFTDARMNWIKRQCFKYKKLIQTEYNEHVLWQDFHDRDKLVITEGIYDAISVSKAGVSVLSPITTGFKDDDIPDIAKKAEQFDDVYLVFDGDSAGESGQESLAKELVEREVEPVLVELEGDQDFDDWTNENEYNIGDRLEQGELFLTRKVEEVENAPEREQSSREKEVLELVSDWELIDVEWILDKLPTRKPVLQDKFEEMQEETDKSGEPSEPSEPSEPHRAGYMESEGELLEELQAEQERESIRMSGITDKGTKLHTTFMKLKGVTKPIVFAERDGSKDLLEVQHKLDEFDQEALESMSNDQKEKNDYHYVNVDDKEVILDPRPLKIEQDTKTPDSGVLDYYKGQEKIDKDIYQRIRDYIQQHWYHYNEEWYDVLAAWIIHTYLLQDIPVTPYIFFTGKKDTGKTQAQRVLNQLAYHSVRNEQPTPASMERQVSYSHSTVHLDEMDKLNDENATRITRTVNTGYNHGATRTIVNTNVQDIERQNQTLHTYSAKTIAANGLHAYSDTVKSRGFIIDSTPKPSDIEIEDIRRVDDGKERRIKDLRNQVFWLSITERENLLDRIDSASDVLDVDNRREDKLSIMYGIISYLKGEERAVEVCNFLVGQSSLKGKDLNKNDEAFLKVIARNTDEDGIEMSFSDIAQSINQETGRDEDSRFTVSPRGVGKKLREYGMIQDEEHKPRMNDGYYARIPREIVVRQFSSHGFDFEKLANETGDFSPSNSNNPTRSGSLGSLGSLGSPENGDSSPTSTILDEIKNRLDDPDRDTSKGVDLVELEEDFKEAHDGDDEKIERLFSEQKDTKPSNRVGIQHLKGNSIYMPEDPNHAKLLD